MTKFIVGKTYWMRSLCNYDCVWHCEVLSRTAKFVDVKISGYKEPFRCKVREMDEVECCNPLGRYSMAPILRAENEEEK